MPDLQGNVLFAQSGGSTAVINALIAGAIQEASHFDCFVNFYGAYNGILGVLREDLFNLRKERADDIENMKRTPSAAMGSCCYKLSDQDAARIIEVFQAHDIRFLVCAGGIDTMGTLERICQEAAKADWKIRVIGVPSSIINNLVHTDHTIGFASAVKYVAASVMEADRVSESLWNSEACTVTEIIGSETGWLVAGAGLARRLKEDAPHLIYLPERPVSLEKITADVAKCLESFKRCSLVVADGIKNADGEFLLPPSDPYSNDAFGHPQLGGVGDSLARHIEKELGIRCRSNKLGALQESAAHFASRTDLEEAVLCGEMATRKAAGGQNGFMVSLVRESGPIYRCSPGTVPLADVVKKPKCLPEQFINEEGNGITETMRDYLKPMLRGQASLNVGSDGLPVFVRLQKRFIPRKLAEWGASE
jgi:ATP-dependent phosphofructokinase / diphosphate-dependent phosphofructokinase